MSLRDVRLRFVQDIYRPGWSVAQVCRLPGELDSTGPETLRGTPHQYLDQRPYGTSSVRHPLLRGEGRLGERHPEIGGPE